MPSRKTFVDLIVQSNAWNVKKLGIAEEGIVTLDPSRELNIRADWIVF